MNSSQEINLALESRSIYAIMDISKAISPSLVSSPEATARQLAEEFRLYMRGSVLM